MPAGFWIIWTTVALDLVAQVIAGQVIGQSGIPIAVIALGLAIPHPQRLLP